MKRRILTPEVKAGLVRPVVNRYAEATARYVPKIDRPDPTPEALSKIASRAGQKCVYYLYEDHMLTVLSAIQVKTADLLSMKLLLDDEPVFRQNSQIRNKAGHYIMPECSWMIRTIDKDNNVRWFPAPLLLRRD